MSSELRERLEPVLVARAIMSQESIDRLTQDPNNIDKGFIDILLDEKCITPGRLSALFHEEFLISFRDLTDFVFEPETKHLIEDTVAFVNMIFPLSNDGRTLVLAMANPFDRIVFNQVKARTNLFIQPVLATVAQIRNCINRYYTSDQTALLTENIKNAAKGKEAAYGAQAIRLDDSPSVQWIDMVLSQAITLRASDIHIEPFERCLRIRFRIDGQLMKINEIKDIPEHITRQMVSRIKVLCNLNTTNQNFPQDGHFRQKVNDLDMNFRVSIMPTAFGDKAVLRLLYRHNAFLTKEQLGFLPADLEKVSRLFDQNHGMVLVTGPTGSGKTTTLSCFLNEMNDIHVNILTVEDPVESYMYGINQVSLNANSGLTFSESLKYMLRQDPDVIMVGEIRDQETAHIAVRASITGHLVLSTLHTSDAVSTIVRMLDMGIEDYLFASVLKGVISQRLVRRICPHCKTETTLGPLGMPLRLAPDTRVFKGKGCHFCNDTGYLDRFAVLEVLEIDFPLQQMIAARASRQDILDYALAHGMTTIFDHAVQSVLLGHTTAEEVLRNVYAVN